MRSSFLWFRLWSRRALTRAINVWLDFAQGFLVASHPEWGPRAWSNHELRSLVKNLKGDIINISAAEDKDKTGSNYREYFTSAQTYSISNYGKGVEGSAGGDCEIVLDLSKPYEGSNGKYDVVFNHTVLEHVFEIETALDTICALTRDLVVTVIPFVQCLHGRDGSYSDYWRLSPPALARLFAERGLKTLYCNWNDTPSVNNVYIVHVASKHPSRHVNEFPEPRGFIVGVSGPGVALSHFLWGDGKNRNSWRKLGEWLGRHVTVTEINDKRGG